MSDIYTPGSVVPFGSVELSPSVSPRRTAAMSAAPAASGLRGLQVDTSAEHDVLARCGFDDGPAPRHHSARSSASKHSATSPMLGSSLLSPSLGTVSPLSTVQLDVSDSDEENGDVVGVPASHGRLEGGIRVPGAHRKSSADVGLGHSARSRPSIRSRRLRKGISDDRHAASSPAASPIRSNGHATGSPRDRGPRRAKSRPSSPIHAPEGAAVPEAQAVTVSKLAAQQPPPATTMEPVRSPIEHDKTAAHGKQGGPPVSPIAGEGNTDKPRGHPQGKKRDVNYDDDDDDFVGELRHDSHPDLGGGARTSRGHRRSSSGSALSSSGDDSSSSSSDSGSSSDDDQRRGSGGASGSVGPGPVASTGRGTRPDSGRGRRRAGAARPLGSLEHNDERKGNDVSPPRTPPRTSRRRSSSGTRGDHETPRDEARSPSEAAESRQADRVKALYERLRALGTKYHALIETMTSSHMYRLPWSVAAPLKNLMVGATSALKQADVMTPSLPEVEDWHMEPADVKVLGTVVRDAAYKIHDFERALTHALDVLQEEDEREFARTIGARGHKRQLSESRSEAGLDTRRARHENPRRDPRSRRRDDWSHHARSERSRRHMRLLRDDERGSRHSARGHRTSRHRSHRDGRDHGRHRDHRDRRQDPRDRLHERHRDHRSHREHRRHRGDREHKRHHRRDHDDDDYERTSRRSSRRTRRHSRDHDRERGNERHDGFSGSTGHTTSLPDLGAGRSHDGKRGAGAGPTSVVHSRPSSTAGSVAGSVTSARSHYGTFYDEQRAHNWQRNYYSSHTLQSQNAAAVAAMRYRRAQLATSGSSTPGMGMSPSPYSALPPRHAGSGSSLDSVPHVVEVSMLNGELESPVPNPYASGTPGTVASVTGTPSPGLASGTPSRRGSRVRRGSGERAAL